MAKQTTNRKGSYRGTKKEGSTRNQYSRKPKYTKPKESANAVLGKFTTQLKTTSSSLVFPEASMSMQAMGNPVQNPGMDNFFDAWNQVFRQAESPSPEIKAVHPRVKRIPNAMCIEVCPYFGATGAITEWGTVSDPIQIAGVNLKQFIDTSYGTVTSYDSQDLMLYLLAVSAVFPMIAEIKRDLKLAVTYQEREYPQYLPKGLFTLLRLCDGDGQYAHGEGAQYTAKLLRSTIDELNQIIFSFNHVPIPPEILAFGYNDDLWQYIYTDTPDTATAQLYVFRQSDYWTYEENPNPTDPTAPPQLVPHSLDESISVPAKVEILREMVAKITALQTSSTAMIQNLYNAYGSKDLIRVDTFEESDVVPLELKYDENILTAINNIAMMPATRVSVTPIVADPIHNRCEGHVYQIDTASNAAINIPLQFHKPYEEVTKEDIGWALRLHPSLRTWKRFDGAHDYLTADGYTGFAIPRYCTIATLGDDGVYGTTVVTPDNQTWMYVALDFAACPTPVYATTSDTVVSVGAYAARRDVEVTYRLEDLRMFWTYLTGLLYGSDLNRNFLGNRVK